MIRAGIVGRGIRASRRMLAVAAAALIRRSVRVLGYRGTALPGMAVEWIDPSVVPSLAADLGRVVFIIGTNGKTTTARLTARILEATDGRPPLANRSGANLGQGLASSLVAAADWRGRLHEPGASAVLEVDELAFDAVVDRFAPTVLVILNLFRDQLDRYGEVDAVVERWRRALQRLPRTTVVVSNADDARVDELVVASGLKVVRFGLAGQGSISALAPSTQIAWAGVEAGLDPVSCPMCGSALGATWRSIGHLGDWYCPQGHVRRTKPDVSSGVTWQDGTDPAVLRFEGAFGRMTARVHLAGMSAAYDAAAAVAAAIAMGIAPGSAIAALDGATPAFGRLEEARVGRRRIVLALVKNPASMAESAEAAMAITPDGLLLGLSDEPADGRDVSWIWDVDVQRLATVPAIGLTGTRLDDLALRLKYASLPPAGHWSVVSRDAAAATVLGAMLAAIPVDGTLVVLATYTSLLAIRAILERRGAVPAIPR